MSRAIKRTSLLLLAALAFPAGSQAARPSQKKVAVCRVRHHRNGHAKCRRHGPAVKPKPKRKPVPGPAAPVLAPATAELGLNGSPLDWSQIANAATQGVKVLRYDASWSLAQPAAGAAYDFSYDDLIYYQLSRLGLRWQPVIDGAPAWAGARGLGVFPDQAHIAVYAAYAVAVVQRYPGLASVEVGNEPEGSQMMSGYPDPAQYEAIFSSVRTAIKQASPGTKVLMAGMAQQPYADQFYRLAGAQLSDGVNIHTYTCPSSMLAWAEGVAGETGYPVVISEYGWSMDGSTPVCPSLDTASFYGQATRTLVRAPHVALVEPFIWAGSSDQLAADIAVLGPAMS